METQNNQFFARNSELSIEFSKYVLEHPEMDDLLTEETIIVFLPEFDVELRDFNLKMAKEIESDGGKPLYVKVKQMAQKNKGVRSSFLTNSMIKDYKIRITL